jgi:hypothetical protein
VTPQHPGGHDPREVRRCGALSAPHREVVAADPMRRSNDGRASGYHPGLAFTEAIA